MTLWAWILDANWKTWIGHAVLGFLIAAVTLWIGFDRNTAGWTVFVAFIYREASDLLAWAVSDDPDKPALREKLMDGYFDLWSPLAGSVLAILIWG